MQIVVLGPHRSGTSLVTGLIGLMGVFVGDDDDTIPPAVDNPRGFWERKDVVSANDAVLAHFGSTWDQLADWSFDAPLRDIPADVSARVARAIAELTPHAHWVVKDPRLCQTAPYWLPFLSQPVAVVVSRDPAEVALSIVQRNQTSFGHALAIWEYGAVGALTHTRALPVVHVSYQDCLDDPVAATTRLWEGLTRLGGPGLTLPTGGLVLDLVDRTLHRSHLDVEAARQVLTPHHRDLESALAGRLSVPPAMARPSLAAVSEMTQRRELVRTREWCTKLERQVNDLQVDRARIQHTADDLEGQLAQVQSVAAKAAEEARENLRRREIALAAVREAATADRSLWEKERLVHAQAETALASDRDNLARQLFDLRRSWSWRFTSPFRLAGYVLSGNVTKVRFIVGTMRRRLYDLLPVGWRRSLDRLTARVLSVTGVLPYSADNAAAIAAIVDERCRQTMACPPSDPLSAPMPDDPPSIDIGVVTFNSAKWLPAFVDSLLALRYPRAKLIVRFVDNSSTDDTAERLQGEIARLRDGGVDARLLVRPNRGYGAGHNAALAEGQAPFSLVTNVDLVFEPDALAKVVATAVADAAGGAWELRQKPYEHPKYYDPVTGETNWNSHACVLLRRAALDAVGRYDDTLFMYGEDVELSYRLRRGGYRLRYCPAAVVHHFSYENPDTVKPNQYVGSTFANLYLRVKFGRVADVAAVPLLGLRLLMAPQAFPGSRRAVARNMARLLFVAPQALAARQRSAATFPFRVWDYDMVREGAFVPVPATPPEAPLVTVITRTYKGRNQLLRQCLLSVAHQTYPNVEHLVVEDGGHTAQPIVDEIGRLTGRPARLIGLDKVGRCVAGNRGLAEARGRWCLFLDDDDLVFADHLEVLAAALVRDSDVVAAYSISWEVITDEHQDGYAELTHRIPDALRQPYDYTVLRHHNFMAIQSVLFERRLFVERGGFDEDMEILEDWMLWIRYAHGGRFAYVPKVTSLFRTPADPARVGTRMDAFNTAYPRAVARVNARLRELESGTSA